MPSISDRPQKNPTLILVFGLLTSSTLQTGFHGFATAALNDPLALAADALSDHDAGFGL